MPYRGASLGLFVLSAGLGWGAVCDALVRCLFRGVRGGAPVGLGVAATVAVVADLDGRPS